MALLVLWACLVLIPFYKWIHIKLHPPLTAEQYIRPVFHDLDHEECWCIFLSCGNNVLCSQMLSKGTLIQTAIDARTVLRQALLCNAKSIILLHNHLSGNPLPSASDINFTEKLRRACQIMDVELIDHIILAGGSFFSFSEERTITL